MNDKARRLPDWVGDIRETIANIRADIGTLSKSEFIADGKSQRAVIKGLTDIGEAANNIMKIAPDLQQQDSEIWTHLGSVYAMRIRLTHSYHRTNPGIVFETVQNDLPGLELLLDKVLSTYK
ncbi:MAG: HepT-like ribonuclease domain-containing protein [Burkholderiales bacterium]